MQYIDTLSDFTVSIVDVVHFHSAAVVMQTGQLEPIAAHFTELEDEQMKNMLRRVDTIVRV